MEILLILIVIGIAAFAAAGRSRKKLATLKERYDTALRGDDKRLALECGRAYYAALRSPRQLTIYDEQAITNDLATMR